MAWGAEVPTQAPANPPANPPTAPTDPPSSPQTPEKAAPEKTKDETAGVRPITTPTRRLLTLEQLMDTKVASTASLTEIEPRKAPAQLTVIDRESIAHCGARDVVELLDIYVPGYQVSRHGSRGRVAGTRGIDSPVKSILLVDGVKMNDTWALGMFPETYLPMLGDIESVEYINGPGSAIYGAGAIGGVINIKTRRPDALIADGEKYGGSFKISHGFVNRGDWAEFQYAFKISDSATLGLYLGANRQMGLRDSDIDFHSQSTSPPGVRVDPGSMTDVYRNPLSQKLMLQLDAGEFKSSLRYTEAEYNIYPNAGVAYQQFNWHNQWAGEIADHLTLKLESNLQRTFVSQDSRNVTTGAVSHGATRAWTTELMTRGTLTCDINDRHKVALGTELVWDWYRPANNIVGTRPPDTYNFTRSLFAEYQWEMLDSLTLIAGGRWDHDRYTEDGFSPRAGLIWTPTADDTVKFLYSESFRDLVAQQFSVGNRPHPDEHIRNYEILYNRRLGKHWSLDLGSYYNKANYIGVVPASAAVPFVHYGSVGTSHGYGGSAAIGYQSEDLRFGLSHNYDEVADFNGLPNPIFTQVPGRDVKSSTFSPHSSKLFGWVKVDDHLSLDGNIQARWKYDGWQYRYDSQTALFKQTYDGKFGPFFSVNLGAAWKFNNNYSIRADAYNLVGLFDRDRNRTMTYDSLNYSTTPASFALTFECKF